MTHKGFPALMLMIHREQGNNRAPRADSEQLAFSPEETTLELSAM